MEKTSRSALTITPAFRRRFVHVLVFLAASAGLFGLFLGILSISSARGRPQPPVLELRLELAKTRLRPGEFPWYRLEIANVGKSIVPIHDDFWVYQERQGENWEREQGTYFQITDEQGKEISLATQWDLHGVFYMWTDDRSGYTPPKQRGVRGILYQLLHRGIIPSSIFWPVFENFFNKWDRYRDVPRVRDEPVLLLRPGERIAATPSIVKPVEPSSRMGTGGDPRVIPYAPGGWSREKLEQLKRTWKQEMEDSNLWGSSRFERARGEIPPPSGFRVLERFAWGLKPGKYRIKAIYDTRANLPALSAEEEIANLRKSRDAWKISSHSDFSAKQTIKKWKTITSEDLKKIRERRLKIEAENKDEVFVESNAIDIQVVQ